MKIKQKVLLLTIVPLVLTVIALMAIAIYELRTLGNQEVQDLHRAMMTEKRVAVKTYVETAATVVKPLLEKAVRTNSPEDIKKLKDTLRSISYGNENGYVFVLDYDGITHVQPSKPSLEGKSLLELKDPNGVFFIKELLNAARNGQGYLTYMWDKPSKGQVVPKLSYALHLKGLDWVLGTGFYIDDVDDAVAAAQKKINDQLLTLIVLFAGIGLVILLLLVVVSMRFSHRSLVQPIQSLSESATQMSLGKMDTEITINSNDEIGELADATKRMQKSLKVVLKKLKQM